LIDLPVGSSLPTVTATLHETTSAIFPLTSVTMAQAGTPGGMKFLSDGASAIQGIDGPNVRRIDLAAAKPLIETTLSDAPLSITGDADSEGNWFHGINSTRVIGNDATVAKFDGKSFAKIATTFEDGAGSGILPFGCSHVTVFGLDPLNEKVLALGFFDGCAIINASAPGVGHFNFDFGGSNKRCKWSCRDGEGNAWGTYDDVGTTGNVVLFRVAAGSGAVDFHEDLGIARGILIGGSMITYDRLRNNLVLWVSGGVGGSPFYVFDIDTLSITAGPVQISGQVDENLSTFRNPTSAEGTFWIGGIGFMSEYNAGDLTLIRTFTEAQFSAPQMRDMNFDPISHAIVRDQFSNSGIVHWLYVDRIAGDDTTLQHILEERSAAGGLDVATEIDATPHSAVVVPGHRTDNRASSAGILEALQPAFDIDMVQEQKAADGVRVRWTKAGGASVLTLNSGKLGVRAWGQPWQRPLNVLAADPSKALAEVEVEAQNRDEDFEPHVGSYVRHPDVVLSEDKETVDLVNLALTETKLNQIAKTRAIQSRTGLTTFKFDAARSVQRLTPATPITLIDDLDNTTYRAKVLNVTRQPSGILRCTAIADNAPSVDPAASAQVSLGFVPKQLASGTASALYVIDGPLVADAHEGLIVYICAGSFIEGVDWPGAVIGKSLDGGDTFVDFETISSGEEVLHGFTAAAFAAGETTVFDRVNTITVSLWNGSTLTSSTEELVLASGNSANPVNACMVRNAATGGWEYIQYVNATLQTGGEYILDTLLRGQRNTENHIAGHAAGEAVLFPTVNSLIRATLDPSEVGLSRTYRATLVGRLATVSALETITYLGRSKMPYSMGNAHATRDGSNNWAGTVDRRSRFGAANLSNMPTGEDALLFECDFLDTPGGAVQGTITTTALGGGSVITPGAVSTNVQTFTLTSADQTTIFGSVQDDLHCVFYQIGSVGRGEPYAVTLSINDP
jgi:hypothetical protein